MELLYRGSNRMRRREQLRRTLPEVRDLRFVAQERFLVVNGIQIDLSVVGQIEELVQAEFCFLAALLVPEDQINPIMDLL